MSLAKALDKLNKTYGINTVNKVKDLESLEIQRFSSGSLQLDRALGGGYPVGRIIEIYGPESSGKTTLALHAIAEVQRQGKTAAFIDAEHALDTHYASAIGVDIDEMILSQPDNGEQALEVADNLARSEEVGLIVIDSVAALTPKSELDGEMGDNAVGRQAKLMAQAMRKLVPASKQNSCTIIFINQIRMKIGVMFGNPETQPGGNALKFAASQRLDIRKGKAVKDGDVVIGNDTKIKVVKNKVGIPHRVAETFIRYGRGLVKEMELLKLGVDLDIIEKSGAWFSYQGAKIGQGQSKSLEVLLENPDLCDEIEDKILKGLELLKTQK
jgi:recombination protein RecA